MTLHGILQLTHLGRLLHVRQSQQAHDASEGGVGQFTDHQPWPQDMVRRPIRHQADTKSSVHQRRRSGKLIDPISPEWSHAGLAQRLSDPCRYGIASLQYYDVLGPDILPADCAALGQRVGIRQDRHIGKQAEGRARKSRSLLTRMPMARSA